MKRAFLALFLLPLAAPAQIPSGYYNGTQGLTGSALQSALHTKIDNHTELSYGDLWDAYKTTDKKPGSGTPGKLWTIYSDKPGQASPYEFTLGTDQCGSANQNNEGFCYNREHTWPQSKFGGSSSAAYTDLWVVYPADYYVNAQRGDHPYGKVASPTKTFLNGGRLGPQTAINAPSSTAYEPIDSFKGDIARTYFYIATRYLGEDASWSDWEMATNAVLKPWAVQMLLQWHQLDPVSDKEKLRNNAAYLEQGNRNPFIDSPRFAECIYTPNCSGLSVEEQVVAAFSIAPNPASGVMQVTFLATGGMLELIDVQGQVWLRREVDEEVELLNVERMPRGLYVVRVQMQSGIVVRQIILR